MNCERWHGSSVAEDWVDSLQARGRYTFRRAEAIGHAPPMNAPNLVLTRSGHLTLSECSDGAAAGLSEAAGAALRAASERGIGELFLCLVTLPEPATMPPVSVSWRGVGDRRPV